MRLELDSVKCEGFGTCADAAPTMLELDEFGYARLVGDGVVAEGDEQTAHEAAAACPVSAISTRED